MSNYTEHPDYRTQLAGIVAEPADDTRRLVLCDWLEELEQPDATARAEFIRVQIHLANVTAHYHHGNRECPECDQVDRWTKRQAKLWEALRLALANEMPVLNLVAARGYDTALTNLRGLRVEFRRGFAAHISCSLADWCGGETLCGRCNGRGVVEQTPDTPAADLIWHGGRSLWGTFDCPACEGLPRSIGKRFAAAHPIEGVHFLRPCDPYRGALSYHWLCEGVRYHGSEYADVVPHHRLPAPIFRSEHISRDGTPIAFPHLEAAYSALSRAALDWAREGRTQ